MLIIAPFKSPVARDIMHLAASAKLVCRSLTAALCLAAAALAPEAQAQRWGGTVGLSSDYVYRGLTQSQHDPALQLDLHYYGSAGWFAGLWMTSVRRDSGDSTTAEFDPYAGFQLPLAEDWSARAAVAYHEYPWNNPGHHYDNAEVFGTLAYADRVFLTLSYSPDALVEARYGDVSGHATVAYELAVHQPLPYALSFNGGAGYYDLQQAVGAGYLYWNAGFGYDLGRWQLNLSYVGTGSAARTMLSDGLAENRLVAALLCHF